MRIVFAGSPAAAVPSLEALVASRHEVVAVITREDSPQGRRRIVSPTPIAEVAEASGIPVIRANRLTAEATETVRTLAPDLGVIVAYGGLVREPLLSAPRLGWINLHFSLLPRWRGAAPVQHAIIGGDDRTGATVFRLVEELDAGDVLAMLDHPIGRHQTSGSLLEALASEGAELLERVVDELDAGTARATPQTGPVTLAPKLQLSDGRIDFTRPATEVDRRIRGVTPEPGAHTMIDGMRVKIADAAIAHEQAALAPGHLELRGRALLIGTATDPIELIRVQPAGRTVMTAADWWRGRPEDAGRVAQ